MKKISTFLTIPILLLFFLTSCTHSSTNKPTKVNLANNISYKNEFLSVESEYNISKINLPDSVKNINDIKFCDNQLYVMGYEEQNDYCMYIRKYDLQSDQEELVQINIESDELFSSYMDIDAFFYNDNYYFCGLSGFSDKSQKFHSRNILGKFNINSNQLEKSEISDSDLWNKASLNKKDGLIYCIDRNFNISIYDTDLNKINSIALADKISSAVDYSIDTYEITGFETDNNGNTYLLIDNFEKYEYSLIKLNCEMDIISVIDENVFSDLGGEKYYLISLKDGRIAICSAQNNYININVFDPNNDEICNRYELPLPNNYYFDLDQNSDYIIKSPYSIDLFSFDNNEKLSSYKCNEEYIDYIRLNGSIAYEVIPPNIDRGTKLFKIDSNGKINEQLDYWDSAEIFNDKKGTLYALYDNQLINFTNQIESADVKGDYMNASISGICNNVLIKNNIDSYEYTILSPSGEIISNFELNCSCSIIYFDETTNEKNIYYFDQTKSAVYRYNVNNKQSEELSVINQNIKFDTMPRFYSDGGMYDFCIINNNALYGYKIKNNTLTEIISNLNALGIENIYKIISSDGTGKLICLTNDSLLLLEPVESKENVNVLKLGYVNKETLSGIYDYINKYNNENPEYKIKIYPYNDLKELNTDIAVGNIPDILLSDGRNCKTYADKGMFTDLSELINNDSEMNISDYLDNIISLYKTDNAVYQLFPSFSIQTMVEIKDFENENWTYDSFFKCMSTYKDKALFNVDDKYDLLLKFIPYYISDYIDLNNKKCDFDNQTFINLIKLIKDQLYCGSETYDKGYKYNCFSKNLCASSIYDITRLDQINMLNKNNPDTELCIKGFPGKNGGVSAVIPDLCISICDKCENKEKAWNFIKYFFTDDYQNQFTDEMSNSIPIKKSAYQQCIQNSEGSTGISYKEIDKIISSVDKPIKECTEIEQIVSEEIVNFFDGTASAENTASVIQRKVNLYLNEKY